MVKFFPFAPERKRRIGWLVVLSVAAVLGLLVLGRIYANRPEKPATNPVSVSDGAEIDLSDSQVASLKIEKVGERAFTQEKRAVGGIDFNQNSLVAVFAPYQGRIIRAFFNVGDAVEKDQVLFTLDSPDLLSAEANLITAASALTLQSRTVSRVKSLLKIGGISQQLADQATSQQETAEGALKAARDAVRIFGKTPEEIDKIVAERIADPQLIVRSPLTGYVTARAAAPGQFVQPGVPPAPFVVADTSTLWMVANVVESDADALRLGQEIRAAVSAYPNHEFQGKITVLGPSIDPITRRLFVRSEIADPQHLLRAGMFANFIIRTGEAIHALAVPQSAVVREGDGTMICWVTKDSRRFSRRVVTVGLRQDNFAQIVSGLQRDELVVGDGAVFVSNEAAIETP
ncbi:efflux RND transporter periplasmic adaptor subunit [Methylocystis sp. 9N]|uniref:Efflux RND transporter periplasmic adaptor subunit n=1 Tax=Methylocystis borbori TaxID=3118750 RepID=A0ABU7XCB3_9HYPH